MNEKENEEAAVEEAADAPETVAATTSCGTSAHKRELNIGDAPPNPTHSVSKPLARQDAICTTPRSKDSGGVPHPPPISPKGSSSFSGVPGLAQGMLVTSPHPP